MLYWWFKKPACAEHVPSSQLTVTLSASRGLPAQKTVARQEWCLVTVGLARERWKLENQEFKASRGNTGTRVQPQLRDSA